MMDRGDPQFRMATLRREDVANLLQAVGTALESARQHEAAHLVFRAAAKLDLADPHLQRSWGGPMNGQRGRRQAFVSLIRAIQPAVLVETGTFRGTTTNWLAGEFTGPIHTCEVEPRLYYQAREKLAAHAHVRCVLNDSRAFLRALLPTLDQDAAALFYLDAHGPADLPLAEELAIILGAHARAVIMIDDFAAPHDPGYGWDDYGPGKQLTPELLAAGAARDSHVFFPSLPSQAETGAKRGCCVLTKDAGLAAKIRALTAFR